MTNARAARKGERERSRSVLHGDTPRNESNLLLVNFVIMKYTAAALIALASVDTVAGFSVSRSSIRQLSQPKNVAASSQQHQVGSVMKMEGALERGIVTVGFV